jgi:hypothetical protein
MPAKKRAGKALDRLDGEREAGVVRCPGRTLEGDMKVVNIQLDTCVACGYFVMPMIDLCRDCIEESRTWSEERVKEVKMLKLRRHQQRQMVRTAAAQALVDIKLWVDTRR